MCTYDRVLFTHMVEEVMGNLLCGAVYTKNTIMKRTILIDRYTQIARGRDSAIFNIHDRLRGQYLLTYREGRRCFSAVNHVLQLTYGSGYGAVIQYMTYQKVNVTTYTHREA